MNGFYANVKRLINQLDYFNHSSSFTVPYICNLYHVPYSKDFEHYFSWRVYIVLKNVMLSTYGNKNAHSIIRIGPDACGNMQYVWF